MLSTLFTVLPIFALVLTGWLARRLGALGEGATREVNRFVVYLALPALLFGIMAGSRYEDLDRPGFVAAFGAGSGLVFLVTFLLRRRAGRAEAAIEALNASYANTGFMGFPLALAVAGREGLTPALIATILTVCVVFAVAIALIESGLRTGRRRDIARRTAGALATNPLLLAPLAGALVPLLGWTLPGPVERYVTLLGDAAAPCALIALGLFLAGAPRGGAAGPGAVALLGGLKLVVQPGVTWAVGGPLLGLEPELLGLAVLLAALPTGTGPFMLAEHYGKGAALTARVVLVTTLVSVLTLPVWLSLAPP